MSGVRATEAGFAAGGAEPWRRVLRVGVGGSLHLRRVAGPAIAEVWHVDVLCGPADRDDLIALGAFEGPLLDVGCGPGRMVRAAAAQASAALGIDVSADAVRRARADGTPALERSVFERLPLEGKWQTLLLMDGNVGIGGNPDVLFARCHELLGPGGMLVAETTDARDLDECGMFTVIDDVGNESAPFPWARVGWRTAQQIAITMGFASAEHAMAGRRHFVRARARLA